MMTTKNSTLKMFGMSAVAALLLSTPLIGSAAEPATPQAGGTPSCNTVMVKTKEFGDSPKEQIEGICKNNRNSPAPLALIGNGLPAVVSFASNISSV